MKKLGMILALLAVCGLATTAFAKSTKTAKAKGDAPFKGKISAAVDSAGVISVVPDGKTDADAVKISTNDQTVVTIDKKSAKVADLKVGMTVLVTGTNGLATKIDAKSAK